MIPAWLEATKGTEVPAGLEVGEALRRAAALRELMQRDDTDPQSCMISEESAEALHALCLLLERDELTPAKMLLKDCQAAFRFVEKVEWAANLFGGATEILSRLAFLCWRNARRAGSPAEERRWFDVHDHASRSAAVFERASSVLAMPITERVGKTNELDLEDSELLLSVCEVLRSRVETSPAAVRDEAEFFYRYVAEPERKIGIFGEREYYLGELALAAGATCRVLFHREEAQRWFDRAEANFTRIPNGAAHIARLGYQRLALAIEERRVDEVLKLTPLWRKSFESMGLAEDALKCKCLEGVALREKGEFAKSVDLFRNICRQAEEQGNIRLTALASTNMAQYCRLVGDLDESLKYARKALPLLKQLDNRMGLVKLRWSVGNVLREQGRLGEAIEAYREALDEAQEVGMRCDVAAIHLVLADVLLEVGQDRQAEWEVRAALPIIEEERMVPEGFAALGLLRDALRYRHIDRKALRELHGYFQDQG